MLYTPASAIMLSFVQIAPLSGKHNNKLVIAWQIYNYLICIHGIFYFWCGYLTSLHSNCYLNVSFNVLFATLHFLCSSSYSSVSQHFFKFILNLNITHHHLFVIFLISVNVLHDCHFACRWLDLCIIFELPLALFWGHVHLCLWEIPPHHFYHHLHHYLGSSSVMCALQSEVHLFKDTQHFIVAYS